MPSDKSRFTMRWSNDETYEKIREIAKRHKRSTAAEIEYLVEQYIAQYEKENGTVETNQVTNQ